MITSFAIGIVVGLGIGYLMARLGKLQGCSGNCKQGRGECDCRWAKK